ncbi:MAG: cupin domain-containing protein [Mycobacterium kyogaense]|uniref:cupin domain-containing protein n=1 Tax=Mycobacterium kyogaense TaxID=2212479 RepID=UPI002FF93656
MQKVSIEALARQQLERAAATGRNAADTVVGGHERILRQTVVGMTAGSQMSEHENPGEATIYVLRGSVRLVVDDDGWDGRAGDLLLIPERRHSLLALEDAAILLTVAKRP